MSSWQSVLKYEPVKPLIDSENNAILYFAKRDLLGESVISLTVLWDLPEANRIVRMQLADGSWKYPGGNQKIRSAENYNQIETFRNLGYLIEMYGFNKSNPVITKAIDFLFSFQTNEGDIRGILGNQYTPYYTAAMTELFIKAGYIDDYRIEKVFSWLSYIRQNDGGWAIPLRTRGKQLDTIFMQTETLEPDKSKPFSHLVTGIVLRAYAAHKVHRNDDEVKTAGNLLLNSLFKKDHYTDRGSADFWTKFTFPFWFTDLISATDSLSNLGYTKEELQIKRAVDWFIAQQSDTGLWKLKTLKNKKVFDTDLWISLSICRILKSLTI